MGMDNPRQRYAIAAKNKQKLLKINPSLKNCSGIYFLTREDENGFKFGYIGQAKHCLERLASHMVGYQQHIDLSIKKHGWWTEENPYGWKVGMIPYPESRLDELEKYWIKTYAEKGYQLRNVSLGGQGKGRNMINDSRPKKGYNEGLHNGYIKCAKEVAKIIEKHCVLELKNPANKISQRQFQKLKDILGVDADD